MSDLAAVLVLAAVALVYAWLFGYRRGHDDAVHSAAASLRYSAALHRAVSSGQERAATLDAQADRLERRLIKPRTTDTEEPEQ